LVRHPLSSAAELFGLIGAWIKECSRGTDHRDVDERPCSKPRAGGSCGSGRAAMEQRRVVAALEAIAGTVG